MHGFGCRNCEGGCLGSGHTFLSPTGLEYSAFEVTRRKKEELSFCRDGAEKGL